VEHQAMTSTTYGPFLGLNNWSLVKEPKFGEAMQMMLICNNQVMPNILLQIWCSERRLSTLGYCHSHIIKEKILSEDIINFINSNNQLTGIFT